MNIFNKQMDNLLFYHQLHLQELLILELNLIKNNDFNFNMTLSNF